MLFENLLRDGSTNWQAELSGPLLRLRPLCEADFESLYEIAADPLIWEQHPDRQRYTLERFTLYFRSGIASKGALAVIEQKTQKIIGSSRFDQYDPVKSVVEIGYTFLSRSFWGGQYNRELKTLMLDHAFRFVDSVLFFVGESNYRSQNALAKIGATEINRVAVTEPEGGVRTSVVYQINKIDWINKCRLK